ncbi:DinB family protein [Kitasatospora sp. NPDC059571]|uniref:DinB family protein n=1 Tax=Kitasatospora sp. NPDC059571 TaxID=3346871 RepID=UPI0036860843
MTDTQITSSVERDALCEFLDKQRDALIRKVEGVSEEDARRAPTASSLTLLGLVKHNALWERRWFQIITAGRSFPGEWPEVEADTDAEDFRIGEEDTVPGMLAYYREQIAASRAVVAALDLDAPCAWPKLAHRDLRWVLLHMIEEVARHAGHADIIRESLDGARGI